MTKFISHSCCCVLFCLVVPLAVAAGVLPGLLADIPVYPNARVTMIQDHTPSAFVTMETAAPVRAIVAYYTDRLLEQGWEVDMEIVTATGASVTYTLPPERTLILDVEPKSRDLNLVTTTITDNGSQ